jgi:hypothetical protein
MRRFLAPLALLATAACSAAACGGASGSDVVPLTGAGCDAGVRDCECGPGLAGTQVCRSDGSVGACNCNNFDAAQPVDAPVEGGTCGDFVCNVGETCANCARDCGECPKCDLAPSCTGAVAVPTNSTHLTSFDNNSSQLYTSGAGGTPPSSTTCLDPKLRLRVRKATITKNGVAIGSLDMYCVIHASDGATSEVAITPVQTGLSDGTTIPFDPSVSLFWGETELHTTVNNLTITYQCLKVTDNTSVKNALAAAASAANAAGGVAGPWGWAFGLGSVAASVAGAAIPSGGADVYLNVQQTIDRTALLDLTNGRYWEIQQNGGSWPSRWDWTLEIESWGCSDARFAPP